MGVLIFILGTIIGSFLNVCIYRIPIEESIKYPSSHCTKCNNIIKFYDLIPVFSYINLRGRCRACGEKIKLTYPLTEFLTGILFFLIYCKFGTTVYFLKYSILTSILIVIGIIDLYTRNIYSSTIIFGIISFFLIAAIEMCISEELVFEFLLDHIVGGIIAYSVLFFISKITRGALGDGDADISLVCGLFFGTKLAIILIFLSFILGGIGGIILLLLKKRLKTDYIAFGPFIGGAGIILIFIGEKLLNIYF